jgi:polysaccharide biosynthesis transport protein
MGLADYRRLIRRWAWLLVLCPLVAGVAAAVVSKEMPPVYEADATVLVKPAQPLNVDAGQAGTGVTSTSDQVATTYAQLMTQPSVLSQVSSDLHLGWSPETLSSKVKVTPQTNTTVIKVAVQDTDARRASAIANKLVEDFSARQAQLNQKQYGPTTSNLQSQIDQLQKSISAEQDRINQLNGHAAQRPLDQADQATLASQQEKLASDQAQYQEGSARLTRLQAQAALGSDSVAVVSPATVPGSPISPRLPLNVGLAVAAGLLLAVGMVLVIHRLDQTVKDDEDLQRRTGLTPLGHIPFAAAAKTRMGELVVLAGRSSAAEAYRGLRTNLLFASVDHPVKTLVITSAAPGEGKSRTAANLAIVLAAAGHTTLLVDADFRRPSLHGFFGKASKRGLSELILNDWSEDEHLIRQVAEIPNLWLLAAGSSPPNPSELLGSGRVTALLGELASRFDYVVLDTPPLNAVTDPALVAAHADGTLLVIEQGRTTYPALTHAETQLQNVGARLLGVVVNKLRVTETKYGYGAYRHYTGGPHSAANGSKVPAGEQVVPPSDAG